MEISIQEGILTHGDNKLRCLRMGHGAGLVVAFHGFGQDASVWQPLAKLLEGRCTLVAFDFPGKSRSLWAGKKMPDNKTMWYFIQKLLDEFSVEQVTLLGYSMGGRPAMCLSEYYPEKVHKAVLIAPDGLRRNLWYRLATHNFYGKLLFQHIVKHPDTWLRRMNGLINRGLVSKKWRKLINNTFSNEQYRERLLIDWPFTRNFFTNPRFFRKTVRNFQIPVEIVMGKYDAVFTPEDGELFVAGTEDFIRLHIVDSGHDILRSPHLSEIAELIG